MLETTITERKTGNVTTGRIPERKLSYRGAPKRALDIILTLVFLPMVLPVLAVLYFLVKRDGGPAFFGHERIGLNGKPFKCWKVRSMVPDAKARLDALLASDSEAMAEWMRDRKLRSDPRITRFGAFLRKSSLDELPQLINVLRGEMSLIGPRPVPQEELDQNYGGHKWVYQSVRPGVTGLWQVSGRNDVSYAERVQMDVDYYASLTLMGDLRILIGTIGAVLKRTGC
ncbi:sugar transferase [Sagittula sp. SSi028]|uniref:sugar transferase n=1 Tax=Sagittula sp. SSi028 TaxID=3400636 RepID=UPI003AF68712